MGFRFRRTIKILPGIRLNVSKSGVSTSVGVRGAHVTIGSKGSRASAGIPGTGISYSEKISGPAKHQPANYRWVLWVALAFFILYAFIR